MSDTIQKKNNNYMSNKEFYAELIECQERGEMSNTLGEMFLMLVTRYASKPKFSGYTYVDEMINNAVLACCQAWDKFDPEKSNNPFAFFTTVAHNAFLQILNKEKKHQRIRDRLLVEENMNPSYSYLEYEAAREKAEEDSRDAEEYVDDEEE